MLPMSSLQVSWQLLPARREVRVTREQRVDARCTSAESMTRATSATTTASAEAGNRRQPRKGRRGGLRLLAAAREREHSTQNDQASRPEAGSRKPESRKPESHSAAATHLAHHPADHRCERP